MTITIDKPKAIELLERAVAEKGADYIYPGYDHECRYERDGKPSCIVGWVLAFAGADVETLKRWDEDVESMSQFSSSEEMPETGVILEEGAFQVLSFAQTQQDKGKAWGEALVLAKSWAKED